MTQSSTLCSAPGKTDLFEPPLQNPGPPARRDKAPCQHAS